MYKRAFASILALFLPFFLMGGGIQGFMKSLFGDDIVYNLGFDPLPFKAGVVGKREISPHVRITGMNGILNHHQECLGLMEVISRYHGGVYVHYIYWNSDGWKEDILKGVLTKIGFLSKPALELAKLWGRLIDEMGGPESGGTIFHFAHSFGAAETFAASTLLSDQERSMIHIITLGPAAIVPPTGFKSVMNYINRRDGVSLIDPVNFYKAYRGELPHVSFVGQSNPRLTHHFFNRSYLKVIKNYGDLFKKNYL